MERTAGGAREAFAALIRRYQGLVLSIAFRSLGSRAEAEDAAQEVFLRLWGAARRYRHETALAAYLRTLTVNFCLDQRRKGRFLVFSSAGEPPGTQDPHGDLEKAERKAALQRALQSLPPTQRMAVVLFHMEGLSMKETADLLEASPKAAESLLSRARTTLRERLEGILRSGPMEKGRSEKVRE
jgi:RNA polymerase sigma-70 factor, ECF subfamily